MSKQQRTPQEKKRLSYDKDRRNNYGENSKSSRKNIPRFKARDIRRERHARNQALHSALVAPNEDQQVAAEVAACTVKRRVQVKAPDIPLRDHITVQRHMKVTRTHRRAKRRTA